MGSQASKVGGAANNADFQWERFEYASDDFTLDKEALKTYFKCSDREIKILFDHFDMDGNGKIDSYELVCALSMLSHSNLDEKAELIFSLYDFDGSKYISRDELVILMTNSLSSLNAMKKQPPPTIKEIEQKTDEFFKKADLDNDKKITLKEFKAYITQDKQILEMLLEANVAKKEDLGMDFGSGKGKAPDLDPDLENECNPKELQKSDKKANVKEGIDFKVKGQDDFFEEADVGGGDQFMAIRPYKGVVDNSVPTKYRKSNRDGEAPDATLQLEHIYGYRCHDARNNLRYTAKGEIIYHAAGVGIVLNQQSNTQRFFLEHNDDIHCLAIDPTGQWAATGQIGAKPWLFIWNTDTMECVARIQGTLLKGIKTIAFSNNGKFVAATAFDDDHTVAVYDWQAKLKPGESIKPFASGKGSRANILSLGFSPNNDTIVGTAVKEVNFWTFANGVVKTQKGQWGGNAQEAVLCQAYIDNALFTGTFSGSILQWNGSAASKAIKAHTDGCQAMYSMKSQKGLISGGGDGLVIIWNFAGGLQQTRTFDLKMPEIKSMMPKARSVCENPKTGAILVGTRGGEIMEFGGAKPAIHMRSHYEGELWGLASHPQKEEFVTIGQDNMLAIWDIKGRKQKQFGKLDCAGNVLAYSHDATKLAIGYINGSFQVLMLDSTFSVHAIRKDRKEAISEIKFSPNDSLCAVGAHDSMIFTYDAKNNFKPLKKMRGHPSTIAHFDFSLDGNYIMSNCTSYNILFFDVSAGKHNPGGASALKDETWESWTCTFGWPVQGIFPPCADGTDINSCDRAPDGTVLATGDDFGMVKLFKFPCPVEKGSFNQYVGHSSHVTNVRFAKKSPYLMSTGGEDKCIFQWKYFLDKESVKQTEINKKTVVDVSNIQNDLGGGDEDMFQEEKMGEGDQRLAVLPFKGEVEASVPAGFKIQPGMGDKPNGNLKLKYAHGFRSFDTRNNLRYVTQNEIAFTTAALGVILDKNKNTQTFFNLHEEDIVSMAIHPEKNIIATGQMAAKGKAKLIDLFVWNAQTKECLAQLNNFHRRAIRVLQFSPQGDKLLSIGEDDYHSVAIYDWANKRMLCNAKVDPDKVFDACWKDDTEFATCGMKHVKFFTIQGQNLTPAKGLYGQVGPTATICCNYGFSNKTFLTGTPKGDLLVWNGRTVGKAQKAHTDALWAIQTVMNGTMIITGGNDAKLIFWDQTYAQKKVIDLAPMSQFQAGVRSLDFHEQTKNIIVGTRGAEIIEINQQGAKVKTLIYGHFEGTKQAELWGCAVHPNQQLFASCGADFTIRVWTENTMVKASQPFQIDLTAIDWSNNGEFLVVGDRNGYIYSVDFQTLSKQGMAKGTLADKENAWVEDLKISPNNQMVVFGTHGGLSKIELVKVLDNGKKLQKIAAVNLAISSAVTHLDWSLDSNSVVINSQAYELMWLDVNSQSRIGASSAKNMDMATWTCVLGFPVQGIWPPGSDFTDVNSVCRSKSRAILATADDFGKVKLFKYPCVVEHAMYNAYMGHSSHVTKVKFSSNDRYVVTTGGNDKTVIVWETDFSMDDPNNALQEEQKQQKVYINPDIDDSDFVVEKIDKARIEKEKQKMEEKKKNKVQNKAQLEEDFFEMADVGQGDEFLAVVPWKNQIKEPSGYQKPPANQNKPPLIQLDLEWVHGYRSRDSRNNISVMIDGSIGYHAAALGIVYDPQTHTQRFFNQHNDDVTAIAFSPDRKLIATGEIGPKPIICIWDGLTMQLKQKIQGKLLKGVQCLAFSPSGKTLAGVAIDEDHQVAVYNVETGACLGTEKGDKAWIIDVAFKDDTVFSTSGVKHFKEWQVGSTLIGKKGIFGNNDQRHGVCKYMGEQCLTGSITGEVYVWSGTSIKTTKKLHDKPVDAIHVSQNYVLTGGKDNKVNILQIGSLNPLFSFTVDQAAWRSICGKVRAMALNPEQNILYVGTLGSEIYQVQIDMNKKAIGPPKCLIAGHYSPCQKDNNEVWGLSIFPNKPFYVTVSDDATLRVWDSNSRKQIKLIQLNLDKNGVEMPLDPTTSELSNATKGRCVDISPDGVFVCVGFRDGSFRIYNTADWENWKFAVLKKPTDKWIQDLKFSPNQKHIAVSSHDGKINIFTFPKLERQSICKASTSAVTHLDWSLDSECLHTNDLSYELLYYRIATGEQDKGGVSSMRDEKWATWTLPLGWPVQGIWPEFADGSDINAVDRSYQPHQDGYFLVASADDSSKVKVFRYPCVTERSEFIEGRGHSSHVTQVKFSRDDKYLYSAGGNDTCIFQWKITK